jgi:hypothetical protein
MLFQISEQFVAVQLLERVAAGAHVVELDRSGLPEGFSQRQSRQCPGGTGDIEPQPGAQAREPEPTRSRLGGEADRLLAWMLP